MATIITATAPAAKHLEKVWSNSQHKWITLEDDAATITEAEKTDFCNDCVITETEET